MHRSIQSTISLETPLAPGRAWRVVEVKADQRDDHEHNKNLITTLIKALNRHCSGETLIEKQKIRNLAPVAHLSLGSSLARGTIIHYYVSDRKALKSRWHPLIMWKEL